MGDQSHNVTEIEGLLAIRGQITGWLDRLDAAGSRAPESVRTKVRADYRARLGQVVAQLGTHADLIASTLEGLRAQAKHNLQARTEEYEIRAEAELRHTVGEYTDDEWQLVEAPASMACARGGDPEGRGHRDARDLGLPAARARDRLLPPHEVHAGPAAPATPRPDWPAPRTTQEPHRRSA